MPNKYYKLQAISYKLKSGFGLLEIIISVALVSVSLFSLAAVGRLAFRATSESLVNIRAAFLAEEGIEALRSIRDDNWPNISSLIPDQPYHLSFSGGIWKATTPPQLIDGEFTRTFIMQPVYRDAGGNIASSGDPDPEARRVVLDVARGADKKTELVSYLVNLFGD